MWTKVITNFLVRDTKVMIIFGVINGQLTIVKQNKSNNKRIEAVE